MRYHQRIHQPLTAARRVACAAAAMLAITVTGCTGEKSDSDGTPFDAVILPTDTLLNLACEDVGINLESCVLRDPENPFATISIPEFDENNPQAPGKFDLIANIPAGPTGAKARFYFWATALARRPSGENQFFTAVALHELWDANSDPLIQQQALKAYRSVLDNFFGSVVFFTCCTEVSPTNDPIPFPVTLNELTADYIYRTGATGFERLVPGDPLLVLSLIGEWGYTYVPPSSPGGNDGFLYANGG